MTDIPADYGAMSPQEHAERAWRIIQEKSKPGTDERDRGIVIPLAIAYEGAMKAIIELRDRIAELEAR